LRKSVVEAPNKARIYVLAGVNGAGKSTVGGAMLAQAGQEFFNPDVAALEALRESPGLRQEEANAWAWQQGCRLLGSAIRTRQDFAFETTLGGNTMARLLREAANSGIEVRIWYVGLETVELHIERVRSRVARGGHDIPEGKIRERYDNSRWNLIDLLLSLAELKLFDNTTESDPQAGFWPEPKLLLHWRPGKIVSSYDPVQMPAWARPILQAALDLSDRE
jgi:predicted ABC-type ATPase